MSRAVTAQSREQTGDAFATAHLRAGLGRRALRGGALTMAGQATRLVIQIGSTILLARLLPPADFGLVAMVVALTGLAALFGDLGLSMATVQRTEITQAQVSTLFWVNVAAGAVIAALVAALAPAIAWFYGEPRLTEITLVLAGTFLLGGIAVQHKALLQRQMRFGALVALDLLAFGGGIATALILAARGAGYWALVANPVVAAVLTAILAWTLSGWRPGLPSRGSGVRALLAFGGHLTGFNLVNYAARNLDNILIGWWWGAPALGLYDRAYKLLMLPLSQINQPMAQVLIPTLSHIQNDAERWRQAYCRAITGMMLATAPLSCFCFVFADPIIPLLLGKQWSGAVPIFRYLAIAGMAQSLCNSVGWLYISRGRSDRMLRWGLFGVTIICLSFVAGLPFGPEGVALAYSAALLALVWPCVAYACHGTPLRSTDVFRAASVPVLAAAAAALCAYGGRMLALDAGLGNTSLLASGLIFVLVYGALVLSRSGPRDLLRLALHKVRPA